MSWSCDRAGFPEIELPDLGLAVQLLPVTKFQFERFLADPVVEAAENDRPARFGDAWYESLLAVSARTALRDIDPDACEALALAGILPDEIAAFARWLGEGYDLPRVDAWRAIDAALNATPFAEGDEDELRNDSRWSRPARRLLDWWLRERRPQTGGELAWLHGGVLEWVRIGPQTFGGLGRPRPEFQRLLLNPQRDEPVRPVRMGRYRYFGARLVRPIV